MKPDSPAKLEKARELRVCGVAFVLTALALAASRLKQNEAMSSASESASSEFAAPVLRSPEVIADRPGAEGIPPEVQDRIREGRKREIAATMGKEAEPKQKTKRFTRDEIAEIERLEAELNEERLENAAEVIGGDREDRDAARDQWNRETYEARLGLNRLKNQLFLQKNFPERYRSEEDS